MRPEQAVASLPRAPLMPFERATQNIHTRASTLRRAGQRAGGERGKVDVPLAAHPTCRSAEADARLEYQKLIEDLPSMQDAANKKLGELKEAGEGAWEDLKAGIDSTWDSLGTSIKFDETRHVMQLFTCGHCGQRLYFENISCTRCEASLGFLPDQLRLGSLEAAEDEGVWLPHGEKAKYRKCANYEQHAACNWMVPIEDEHPFCTACRLNATIPDLGVEGNIGLWRTFEMEKRRLVYSLLRLGLPLAPRSEDPAGLAFDCLADTGSPSSKEGKVFTGHAEGVITINIKEADPAERERMRVQLDEPYRTLLGHFRHESGHYYWDRLIQDTPWLEEYRSLFGDDTADYGAALEHHYEHGAPADWQESFISSYSSMHPWEDWAETWAHYLHIVDTLETAWQFDIRIRPKAGDDAGEMVRHDFDPYREASINTLIEHWIPLTFALNSLNRSMGHEHAYPFLVSPRVIEKLGFVHRVVRRAS